ncbi:LOW QUALITY PROTEIN: uncharacterized protein LOC105280367 [Ooceraea biroi]|uniref:LOW QUALITY PROTEIN: uncharacterized protein LOC105280367 n=1 Tax=Ooceraea biroi TaxID=2015173 RepID=UPI000F085B7C|nr:LOW QUALITY PROTEIN: uncharacterized protein LOC105280367 [Ooceraea biroi]
MRENNPRREIDVEFGEVETGAEAVRMIEIANRSCIEQITYEAHRDTTTNPLDHVFELCSYSWTLFSGQVYKCRIYYRPFVPFSVNVDYFTIVDSAGERAEIRVRGMCIGPVVSSSTTRLVMVCTGEKCETKKRIKLVNESSTKAVFMFDIDLVQSSFKVDPEYGHIGPRSRRYVTITFVPREAGLYTHHLPCLILNHKPIIIELYGYCGSPLRKADIQTRFNYPTRLRNGFEGYTSDTMQDLPVVSLSKSYIDFGQVLVETEIAAQNIPQTLCLINHSQSDVLIKWGQDVEGIFNITPATASVLASQTALFEVAFNPTSKSNLFVRELVGYVFTKQQEDYSYEGVLAFPTITSVRLIGHSFPVCPDDWIPQYEIPRVVKMPPSVPSFLTYTTFVIRKFNRLPLMYCFVPPASSRFIVKPLMGIINQDYQIVVVGMLPGIDNEHIYEERWAIHFNGNTKSECFINFRGFTECANINFNNQKNVINLTSTFPGCRQTQLLHIRNVTRHMIRYEFINAPPELQIQNASGEIYPNDIVTHKWEFCPLSIGDYKLDLNCILIVLKDEIPIGSSINVMLRAIGKCELGFLTITDLQCYGPCPDMSKVFLWKLMDINRLNTLLRELPPGTSKTLYINFPAMALCERPAVIKLLVTSATAVIASWNVKRVQLCSCRPVVKTEGLSFQRATYDCLHRKICSVQPRTGNLERGEENWITLELYYILPGKTEAKWDLDLGDGRHIFLIMAIEGLSESDNKLCLLSGLAHFRFQHVYLGDKSAVYQVCWLHNGTNNSIPFSIHPRTMREINRKYCYKVFSCATTHAVVNPLSSVPILLKFQPRQFGIFKGKLRLTLGDEEKELTLEGESSLPHEPMMAGEYVPSDCGSRNDDIHVYFNTDCIDIPCISTHSHAVRMIIMNNKSLHDVFAYEWKRLNIPGVIRVDIHPRKGLIKPMCVKTFRATVYSEEHPCVIDVNVPCEFINTCERRAYQRSVYKHEDLCRELEQQFTITEKGVSVPEPWIKVLVKPQPFYRTITIRCFIYSVEDKFLKVSLKEELISAPPKQICIEENGKCTMTFTKEDVNRSSFIIEGLLWEIVNSKLFKNLMQDISQDKPNLFYSQFTMNPCERKRLIRRSYISPPRALINHILEKMLFVILHEEFGLKATHLIEHTDIRHKSYLDMVPGINRGKTIRRSVYHEIFYFIFRKRLSIISLFAMQCVLETQVQYQEGVYPEKPKIPSTRMSRISFAY